MNPVTLFSWGYWGWGNATAQFVEAVDAVETARGFAPPLFVDIRISRSVRAVGFTGNAFANLVGPGRYSHEPDLGNLRIKSKTGPRIQIRNPGAAERLLDIALSGMAQNRRLLFFCSCGWPIWTEDGEECLCHRVEVGSLVLAAASSRGLSVDVVEWPGVSAREQAVEIAASPDSLARARTGAAIPLAVSLPAVSLLGLPWGSRVEINSEADSSAFFAGPAQYSGGRWRLPKITDEAGREVSPADGPEAGMAWRQRWGFAPRRAGAA